jgi:tetrahydromethanopterin S-methyltransferase subunit D
MALLLLLESFVLFSVVVHFSSIAMASHTATGTATVQMAAASSTHSFSADALRSDALKSGKESRVEVNQRLLIDKMLARYSSQFVVARELIQVSTLIHRLFTLLTIALMS